MGFYLGVPGVPGPCCVDAASAALGSRNHQCLTSP